MTKRPLPIQVRAYPRMDKQPRVPDSKRPINWVLTFDTETSTDHTLRLHFGCFRLSTVRENDDGTIDLFCVREGMFYADDLDDFFPGGVETIKEYCFSELYRHAKIANRFPTFDDYKHGQLDMPPNPEFELMTASEFIRDYIVGCGYTSDVRGTYREYEPATIVGFNLPFDMTRLGQSWSTGRKQFYKAFSVSLTPWLQFRYKKSGAHGWYMRLSGKTDASNPGEPRLEGSNLVDAATIAFALGGKLMSLRAAGEAFGCKWLKSVAEDGHGNITLDYIDYCRQDVRATEDLYRREMEEYNKHPISQTLKPDSAYSPASISKQYMRDMGIVSKLVGQGYAPINSLPPSLRKHVSTKTEGVRGQFISKIALRTLAKSYGLPIPKVSQRTIPPEIIGRFMCAFFGGRSECRIRMTKVPAVLVDFTSMYPTVILLLGIWEMLTSDNLEIVEVDAREIQQFLESLTLESDSTKSGWETSLFNPTIWPQLSGVAETDSGYLPIRSEYNGMTGSSPGIGINYLESYESVPYTLLDLAASRIATGRTPTITHAWKLQSSAQRQTTLKPVDLYGDSRLRVDPNMGNLLKMAVEQRQAAKGRHQEYAVLHSLGELQPVDETCPCRDEKQPCYDCGRLIAAEHLCAPPGGPTHKQPGEGWEMLFTRIQKSHANDNRRSVWSENRDKCLCPECVAERFLKVFANAIYGVFAEMNTPKKAIPKLGEVYGLNGQRWTVKNPEEPGEYCFPPFASLITGGARLMLAMLEKSVTNVEGCHVFCDTDSLCIVASRETGAVDGIPIISHDVVNEIRERFNKLNPYNRDLVPEILKWEAPKNHDRELYCVAISAKRYCLFHMDGDQPVIDSYTDDLDSSRETIEVEKRSEHGLGLYLNPISQTASDRDWYSQVWLYIINKFILNREAQEPEWFSNPAALRATATSPEMLKAFAVFNDGWPYGDQVKPHNFMLSFIVSRLARMLYPNMRLVVPYVNPDELADWQNLTDVYDIHGDHTPLRIKPRSEMTNDELQAFLQADSQPDTPITLDFIRSHVEYVQPLNPDQPIPVRSYRDIVHDYVKHPEVKYDDVNGNPCTGKTRGRLYPTTIIAEYVQHIGKTGNPFFNAAKTLDEIHYRDYDDERREPLELELALEVLPKNAAEITRMLADIGACTTRNTVAKLLRGAVIRPRSELRTGLMKLARSIGEQNLEPLGFTHQMLRSKSDFFVLTMWHNRNTKRPKQ